jgi:hypothetical protein
MNAQACARNNRRFTVLPFLYGVHARTHRRRLPENLTLPSLGVGVDLQFRMTRVVIQRVPDVSC